MDFQREIMEKQGFGNYEKLNISALPPLFVAYREDLGEGSETIHQNVRERWLCGDQKVKDTMEALARCAEEARELILAGRGTEIGPILDRNFDLRCSIFNVDQRNRDMVARARALGTHAKLAGSGGAIVGIYTDESMYEALVEAFREDGVAVFKPQIEAELP
jgi:glucuronokinase